MINHEHARTIAIVQELAEGKTIEIDGYTIGMGEDMSIGVIMTASDGQQHIGGLSTMDLAQFNDLLNKHNIGYPIKGEKRSESPCPECGMVHNSKQNSLCSR